MHMFLRRAFSSTSRRCSQRSQQEVEAYKRKRQAEWKRKQGGNSFLDHLVVTVRGGKGGDGCAAFHREKFKPYGPPSGGNGGRGGDVYFKPTPSLSTLSTVLNRIMGHNGEHGKGTWQNGKAGETLVIKVPLGTVVRELGRDDPRRSKDEWENEEEAMAAAGLTTGERVEKMREKRWVHYPGAGETNIQRDDFKEVEASMYKLERERRLARRRRLDQNPIFLDLDKIEAGTSSSSSSSASEADNAPLGIRQPENLGHLIAQGGLGGFGNPHFVSSSNRTPRYGTRGHEGERVTLFLELKLLADIGLVGMPNAGKSTLLRALTGGRAKTDVAGYAFTTLNPVVGIVRVAENGIFEGELVPDETIYDETKIEEQAFKSKMERGDFAHALTRNQVTTTSEALPPQPPLPPHIIEASSSSSSSHSLEESVPTRPGHHFDLYESFRFTLADNPGLIENSASPFAHAGLGHSFLRAIERSPALICVVDFSAGVSHHPQSEEDLTSPPPMTTTTPLSSSSSTPHQPLTGVTDVLSQTTETESSMMMSSSSSPEIDDNDVEEMQQRPQSTIDPITIDVDPCTAIKILKSELETYQHGMSSRIRMVIANKADLVATPTPAVDAAQSPSSSSTSSLSSSVEEAWARLKQLEEYVKKELGEDVVVVPVSAKYRMNLRKVVALMKGYVEDARAEKLASEKEARERDW